MVKVRVEFYKIIKTNLKCLGLDLLFRKEQSTLITNEHFGNKRNGKMNRLNLSCKNIQYQNILAAIIILVKNSMNVIQ